MLLEKEKKQKQNRANDIKRKQMPLTQEPLKANFLLANPSEQASFQGKGLASQRPRKKKGADNSNSVLQ